MVKRAEQKNDLGNATEEIPSGGNGEIRNILQQLADGKISVDCAFSRILSELNRLHQGAHSN